MWPDSTVRSPGVDLETSFLEVLEGAEDERPIRAFLSEWPHLLVGARHVLGEIVLEGIPCGPDRTADFAFVELGAGSMVLHLVELQSPRLQLIDAYVEPTEPLRQRCQWLRDCSQRVAGARSALCSLFGPWFDAGSTPDPESLRIFCKLVAGRRAELSTTRRRECFTALREGTLPECSVRTYDGLLEEFAPVFRIDSNNQRGIRCVTRPSHAS